MITRTTKLSTRRELLRAAGLGAGAFALAGCTSTGPRPNQTVDNSGVELPAYRPYTGVEAAGPATAEGVQPYFEDYPATSPRLFTDPPASGTVTAMASVPGPSPKPLTDNPYWQELNRRLGGDLEISMTPSAGYPEKFSAVVASGDLPDLAELRFQPNLPQLLKAKFADLTSLLSGDAVKDFPALANIPSYCWQSATYNGGIYGVPQHRPNTGTPLTSRMDIRRDLGLDHAIDSGAAFVELCRELTDSRQKRWAMGAPVALVQFFVEMLEGPNQWRVDGGRFTSAYETEEFTTALDQVARMWTEGLFHPDSFGQAGALTPNPGSVGQWLLQGSVVLNYGGTSWLDSANGGRKTSGDPDYEIAAIPPPRYEGGGTARKHLGTGVYALTGISNADPDRVAELLHVVDWLSAPFGTEEQLFKRYGIEGRNFTREGTDPVPATGATQEILLSAGYLGAPPIVNYAAGAATIAKQQYDYQSAMARHSMPIPTVGLFSDTYLSKGATLERTLYSVMGDIIQGRRAVSSWADAVQDWRNNGGDTIRSEYEASYQQEENR